MWHIHGIISVWHCSMPLGVSNTRTRTVNYRHGCGPAYIDISIDNSLLCYRTDVADTARIVDPHNEDHGTALGGR